MKLIQRLLAHAFIALLLLTPLSNIAQSESYEPGELLIQVDHGHSPSSILAALRTVDGNTTMLRNAKLISNTMRVWLYKFDDQAVDHQKMLEAVRNHPHVINAQFNHNMVTERITLPNDPNIGQQWHHVNAGGGGGLADADIDSDEAWDITTGGVTALGDTIVVCILEGGGGDLSHPDLQSNAWINYGEIPGDNIDNDNNGYVDDYLGWNVNSNDDNIGTGGHGTQVAGMIGAKGDNTLGVVGANWNVKMMMVAGNSTNEASVLAAYDYPLTMRRLYNNSNGAEGAYVVVTNASWGIDGGQPANAPLWCAMYDTLGVYGVLNCGATANQNWDIDQTGDLPTGCPSDYMVSVTATNNSDVRTFSGYGILSIDVGAPGEDVYTTSSNGNYGATSGTSFASPLTAGIIGLMYSVPCPSFMALAKADPQMGADIIRQALFDGVDPVSNLANETVYGGRVNSYNSLMEMMNNCDTNSCIAPYTLSVSGLTDTSTTLNWNALPVSTSFNVQYRPVGSPTWTTDTTSNLWYNINGLMPCTLYEFMVQAECDTTTSAFSDQFVFQTDGCCEAPTGIAVANITDNSANISWNSVLAAISYNLRVKPTASPTWTDYNGITNNPFPLTGLTACTEYEVQIATVCDTGTTAYTNSITFTTTGCGACIDNNYCASASQDASEEWIGNVSVGTINNTSGTDGGYGDYTGLSTDLERNGNYTISMTPDYAGQAWDEYFMVWIDYNQDGDFDDAGENIYDAGGVNTATVTGNFTVPGNALLGSTRMRVGMQFDDPLAPCDDNFQYGEVEDYCVNIILETGVEESDEQLKFNLFPNPAGDLVTLMFDQVPDKNTTLVVFNALGDEVMNTALTHQQTTLSTTHLAPGVYVLQVQANGKIATQNKLVIQR